MEVKLSKYFWVTTQEEFSLSNAFYICNGSPLFRKAWRDKKSKAEIKALEKKFADEMNYDFKTFKNANILFKKHKGFPREIRLNFLNWVIENYETK